MNYISMDEAVSLTGQDYNAIRSIIRLVEDGNFPANTIKRYYINKKWVVYVDSDFITSQVYPSGNNSICKSKDAMPLAASLAFIAVFGLIWYVGNTMIQANQDNLRLQTANKLQRKALDEAYQLIINNRDELASNYKTNSTQPLGNDENRMDTGDAGDNVEISFDNISPEKVAVE